MAEGTDAQCMKTVLKSLHFRLDRVHRHTDAAHKQPHFLKGVDQAQHVHVIGDAVVATHFVADDILSADDDYDLGLVLQLQQHLQFGIRVESGQYPGSMVVIKQFAAELQIQFVVKLGNPLTDVRRLHGQVFVVIKSDLHVQLSSLSKIPAGQNPAKQHIEKSIPHPKAQCNVLMGSGAANFYSGAFCAGKFTGEQNRRKNKKPHAKA